MDLNNTYFDKWKQPWKYWYIVILNGKRL